MPRWPFLIVPLLVNILASGGCEPPGRRLGAATVPGGLHPPLANSAPSPLPRDMLPAKLSLADIPLGLGERPVPKDSPLTEARVRLGRKLFFDPVLSADGTVACATCHAPEHGFAGPGGRPRGIRGRQTSRKAPSLFNRAYGSAFFWDGRAAALEEQALRPIADPDEMGSTVEGAVTRLKDRKDYRALFAAAFDDGVTAANLAKALASFERVLLRGDSRVDRFRRKGEHDALTAPERHGLWLYESKARCWKCHGGANFTDEAYHNTGVSWGNDRPDLGRGAVTRKDADKGKFKTPTLRGVALTGPYMHDGSLKTLEDVIEFYNRGGSANANLDPALQPLGLSKDEVKALVAFLKAL
ncbi:MAG: c-type cytochrome [Planctomycetes bacterium]|nr:c-type cytochrome [Planctomycetota bacterium]